MNAREYLSEHLRREARELFGNTQTSFLDSVVDEWMEDSECPTSKYRFAKMHRFLGDSPHRILDIGSGCGNFTFYGLLNGYDSWGIEPEEYKLKFLRMKAAEKGYPPEWVDRFKDAVGEALPFEDNSFDCVSSLQTLEHVDNVDVCLSEMLRVTKPGGGIYIRCPDHSLSTFEGHYRLQWLPLLWKHGGRPYLRLRGKPLAGFDTIKYVSFPSIAASLRRSAAKLGVTIEVINIEKVKMTDILKKLHAPSIPGMYLAYLSAQTIRFLFRVEMLTHVFAIKRNN